LRLHDNAALYNALKGGIPVLPIFIFDKNILDKLEDRADSRVTFLYDTITDLQKELEVLGSTLHVFYGEPVEIWRKILKSYNVNHVFTNRDYENYAIERDNAVEKLLKENNTGFSKYKDHVIFENDEVGKDDGKPYTIFTPYSKKWKAKLSDSGFEISDFETSSDLQNPNPEIRNPKSIYLQPYPTEKYFDNFIKAKSEIIPTLEEMSFSRSSIIIPSKIVARKIVVNYDRTRNFPGLEHSTTRLGIHFRFGTISIREKALAAQSLNETYLNELIWRDFYSMILQHFPHVERHAFRPQYEKIEWLNDEKQFEKWCEGKTGYPLVDAGMRQLNATGYMHNRVRMTVSSFLTKHLLIDWRWGEAYFAKKLLDFDLASNNGGWQWAAGCGTDAAPYFRIFNPQTQREKFDADGKYVKKWVPEIDTPDYPKPIVEHKFARERCLEAYKRGINS
jgi:deoxyribodipyrimidine photo-lyase